MDDAAAYSTLDEAQLAMKDDERAWLPEQWLEAREDLLSNEAKQAQTKKTAASVQADTIDRACSSTFIDKLREEAKKESWFSDVLRDRELIIAPRGQSLNVYWLGQSIFLVRERSSGLAITTHPKYLLDPDLDGQVSFSDDKFGLLTVEQRGFVSRYISKAKCNSSSDSTIEKLKRSSCLFSGFEKTGCHKIGVRNSSVIDCEIQLPGFRALFPGNESKGARIDLATIESFGDKAKLVFWEAKHFSNGELRATLQADRLPEVCAQIEKYRKYLGLFAKQIAEGYASVAKNFFDFRELGWQRNISQVILDVAQGKRDLVMDDPTVGLVIFGFDRAQRDDPVWQKHLRRLYYKEAGISRIVAAGDPRNIKLPN